MRITGELLRALGACVAQVRLFEYEWPAGAEVAFKTALRAQFIGLNLGWFAKYAFTATAAKAYFAAVNGAERLYNLALLRADCIYRRELQDANISRRVAGAACGLARARAEAAYQHSITHAFVDEFERNLNKHARNLIWRLRPED